MGHFIAITVLIVTQRCRENSKNVDVSLMILLQVTTHVLL